MTQFTYRLYNTMDPEERLEEAVMWKALHDVHGDDIEVIPAGENAIPGTVFFGRADKREVAMGEIDGIGLRPMNYWSDQAFLENCGRAIHLCDFDQACRQVAEIHAQSKDAFVKSMSLKHYASLVPAGVSLLEHLDGLEYSFIDIGTCLMVQEAVQMQFEQRFLFVEGELITSSTVQTGLTPAARLPEGHFYRTPSSRRSEYRPDVDLSDFAKEVVRATDYGVIGIDCAFNAETQQPLVIEFNPFQVGQMGLYACDPWAIAEATKSPIFQSILVPGERPQPKTPEEIDEEVWADRWEHAKAFKGFNGI